MGRMPERFAHMGQRSKPEFFSKEGQLGWPKPKATRQSKRDVRNTRPLEEVVPPIDNINRQFLDLVRRLLTFDPAQRITVREALNHPYFSLTIPQEIWNSVVVVSLLFDVLVWFLFFWVRSWSKCFIHSFLWSFFLLPTLLPSSLFASYSSFVCFLLPSAMSCCYASSLLTDPAMMIVRSLSYASPPIRPIAPLGSIDTWSHPFFFTPQKHRFVYLGVTPSFPVYLPTFSATFKHHLISPHHHEGVGAKSYVVFSVGSHVRSQGFFVRSKITQTSSLLSLSFFYIAMSSPSFCLVL